MVRYKAICMPVVLVFCIISIIGNCLYGQNPLPKKYLIITDEYFADAIAPLREWKQRKGLETDVAFLSEGGGGIPRTATAIRDYIKSYYDTYKNDYDIYVLLIGDPETLDQNFLPMAYYTNPIFVWSDHYYSCVTVDPNTQEYDLYPDIQLGRMSPSQNDAAGDYQMLVTLSDRAISFETNPPSGSWMKNYVIVASTSGVPEYITSIVSQYQGTSITEVYGWEGAANQDIKDGIEAGTGIVNYSGHGQAQCWEEWNQYDPPDDSWWHTDALALENGDKRPLIYSITCFTASIQNADICLGEAFLNAPQGGAVGFYGYTFATNQPYKADSALWDATFPVFGSRITITGDIQNYSDSVDFAVGHSGANVRLMASVWLGDPCLDIWTEVPADLVITHPTEFEWGQDYSLHVSDEQGSVEGALVCLWNKQYELNQIHLKDYSNSGGYADISTIPSIYEGPAFLTGSKHDYLPYLADVSIVAVAAPSNLNASYNEFGKIVLTWTDNSNNNTGFTVARQCDGTFWNYNYANILFGNATQWTDNNVFPGHTYTYMIRAYDGQHVSKWSNQASPGGELAAHEESYSGPFVFDDIVPNPVTNLMRISYISPDQRNISIRLYDITGRLAADIYHGCSQIGTNKIIFNSQRLPGGVYFIRCEAEETVTMQKVVIDR